MPAVEPAGATLSGPMPFRPSLARILLAAGVVAVADLIDAVVVWVVIFQASTLPRILQSIASGLLGRAAFAGGTGIEALGLVLHFCVALGWTLVFVALLRAFPRLQAAG